MKSNQRNIYQAKLSIMRRQQTSINDALDQMHSMIESKRYLDNPEANSILSAIFSYLGRQTRDQTAWSLEMRKRDSNTHHKTIYSRSMLSFYLALHDKHAKNLR